MVAASRLHRIVGFTVLGLATVLVPDVAAVGANPPMTISSDRPSFLAGTEATVRVTTYQRTHLTVTAQRPGGQVITLMDANANPGVRVLGFRIRYNTTVIAQTTTEQSTVLVGARPLQTLQQPTPAGRDHRYHVYPRDTEPLFVSTATPSRPGVRCRFYDLERYVGGEWLKAAHGPCITENRYGRIAWRWRGAHRAGIPFRIRSIFAPSDEWNTAGLGRWGYFRFRSTR